MSVHEPAPFRAIPSVEADRAMKFGVGVAAAPLWATFFTAAGAGMAYWWMSAVWTRREPKAFSPARNAAQIETGPLVQISAEAPAPRPEPMAAEPIADAPIADAPVRAPEPSPAAFAPTSSAPAPAPSVEAHPAHRAPETLAAATPVAAGLEPAVEPEGIASVVDEAKPVHTAPRKEGPRAEGPAAGPRRPPVRRKP